MIIFEKIWGNEKSMEIQKPQLLHRFLYPLKMKTNKCINRDTHEEFFHLGKGGGRCRRKRRSKINNLRKRTQNDKQTVSKTISLTTATTRSTPPLPTRVVQPPRPTKRKTYKRWRYTTPPISPWSPTILGHHRSVYIHTTTSNKQALRQNDGSNTRERAPAILEWGKSRPRQPPQPQ